MKLEDITLRSIKDYLNYCEDVYDGAIQIVLENKDGDEKLYITRFNGEWDDWDYIGSICKNRDNEFEIETASGSVRCLQEGIDDEDNTTLQEVVSVLLTRLKGSICEEADCYMSQISFLNDFGEKCKLDIRSVTTCDGNFYE